MTLKKGIGFERPVNRIGLPQNESHIQNSSTPKSLQTGCLLAGSY